MSFGLPAVKVKPDISFEPNIKEGTYGVPDLLTNGFASVRKELETAHPLAKSEANYATNQDKMGMAILRNTQGIHAPLKIAMEVQSAKKIGRLPFLPSSNVMLDSLTGKDLEIGFEDILNTPEFREVSGQPHAIVEKSLGIL